MDAAESVQFPIREILENATQHFDGPLHECEVTIAIDVDENVVQLEIDDNGPGIPTEELQSIQQNEETRLVHTNGVGLWLVTWLTDVHNGTVEYQSDPETGTTVCLRFDAAMETQFEETQSHIKKPPRAILE